MTLRNTALALALAALAGCQSTSRPEPVEAKESLAEAQQVSQTAQAAPALPKEVQAELMPELNLAQTSLIEVEHRFDVNARNVSAKAFFPALVKGTPMSIAMHPDVDGQITLKLTEVTLKEALEVVADIYGYDIQRRGKVLHIYPADMRVETIPLNYLMLERYGYTGTRINSGGITNNNNNNSNNSSNNNSNNNSNSSNNSYGNNSNNNNNNNNNNRNNNSNFNGTRIESTTDTRYWTELEETLRGMIGIKQRRDASDGSYSDDGRMVVVSPQAGLVTVRGYPDEIRTIREFIERSERNLQRQVVLDAKIIEVTLSDGYQQGISWTNAGDTFGDTDVLFDSIAQIPGNAISNVLGGGGALTISSGNFEAVVELLETQGDVNVLSSPRITASNNQKAVIKVGTDEYFVTDVSNTTITGTNPVTNPSVELTPFFSGVALDVTPQINSDHEVLLHVHPSVTDVTEQRKVISFGGSSGELDLPLAKSDIRESDTIIKAKSGDMVVIGGLMRTKQEEIVSRTPVIGSIPGIGELFTNRSTSTTKSELVILIQPRVVQRDTWKQELDRSQELLEKWYPSEQ